MDLAFAAVAAKMSAGPGSRAREAHIPHDQFMSPRLIDLPRPFRRRLSRRLVGAARDPGHRAEISVGELVETLGDRSFGWSLVIFALVNMLPMPVGTDMVFATPVLLVSAQMALGYDRVRLPGVVDRRRVGRKRFQKLVLWLGPVIRPMERLVRPRLDFVFVPRTERAIGIFLLFVGTALFLPIPGSGYVSAAAVGLTGLGLVERDGLAVLAGIGLGLVAIGVTIVLAVMLFLGVEALAH